MLLSPGNVGRFASKNGIRSRNGDLLNKKLASSTKKKRVGAGNVKFQLISADVSQNISQESMGLERKENALKSSESVSFQGGRLKI